MQFIKFLSVNVFHVQYINRLMCLSYAIALLRKYSLISFSLLLLSLLLSSLSVSPFFKYYIYALSMLLQMSALLLLLLVPPSSMATMHETTRKIYQKKGLRQRPNVVYVYVKLLDDER